MTPEQKDELTTGFRLLIAIVLALKAEEIRGELSDLKEMALLEACARCRKDVQGARQVFDLLSAAWRRYERWLVCKN